MALAEWKKEMEESQLPKEVVTSILEQGYVTKVAFTKAFRDKSSLDDFIERLLNKKKILGELADGWECHPVAGMLRGLWSAPSEVLANQADLGALPEPDVTSLPALLGISGTKLEVSKIQELWKRFDKDFPSEALDEHSRPCRQLIQQIYNQKKEGDLRFIPWKYILSEAQWDNSKTTYEKKEKSLLSFLAEAAGHQDIHEGFVSPSPFGVQKILSLRGIGWALVGWCHLGTANALMRKFVALYSQYVPKELGLRAPSLAEAEAADVELCRRLGEKVQQGWTLDQALQDCVEGSAWLSSLLQLRPRMPLSIADTRKRKHMAGESHAASVGKGKGKGKGRNKGTGTCFKFQVAKCTRGDECRFKHECEHCGKANHGRSQCPELIEG